MKKAEKEGKPVSERVLLARINRQFGQKGMPWVGQRDVWVQELCLRLFESDKDLAARMEPHDYKQLKRRIKKQRGMPERKMKLAMEKFDPDEPIGLFWEEGSADRYWSVMSYVDPLWLAVALGVLSQEEYTALLLQRRAKG